MLVLNFHLSARSSFFFLAFSFTFMQNLFKKHPIPKLLLLKMLTIFDAGSELWMVLVLSWWRIFKDSHPYSGNKCHIVINLYVMRKMEILTANAGFCAQRAFAYLTSDGQREERGKWHCCSARKINKWFNKWNNKGLSGVRPLWDPFVSVTDSTLPQSISIPVYYLGKKFGPTFYQMYLRLFKR